YLLFVPSISAALIVDLSIHRQVVGASSQASRPPAHHQKEIQQASRVKLIAVRSQEDLNGYKDIRVSRSV
ncbi:hypothetical protein, partial [Bacteroides uniformis]|uniref:hypothetical protein n=1 Tax=Bacteroides uniformis TaxID=820 RepID=UPI001AA0F54E